MIYPMHLTEHIQMARTDDRHVHLELVDHKTEEERWREEALHELRPRPELQAKIDEAKRRRSPKTKFQKVMRFLRGGR